MKLQHNHRVWHEVKDILKEHLEFFYSVAKWIGWFISDVKFKYKMSLYKNELCSSCFGKLTSKKPYWWFDYKRKTFYICKDCYDKLHNKN